MSSGSQVLQSIKWRGAQSARLLMHRQSIRLRRETCFGLVGGRWSINRSRLGFQRSFAAKRGPRLFEPKTETSAVRTEQVATYHSRYD